MAIRSVITEQYLPIPLAEAWDFFSTPLNLSKIKPQDMLFRILSELPDKIYPGLMIHYRVAPVWHVPFSWTTEITQVDHCRYFIDEQRAGPFRLWHHEHHFAEKGKGTLMRDVLHYDIGRGWVGRLAGSLFVHTKVKWIFDYRYHKLEKIFSDR